MASALQLQLRKALAHPELKHEAVHACVASHDDFFLINLDLPWQLVGLNGGHAADQGMAAGGCQVAIKGRTRDDLLLVDVAPALHLPRQKMVGVPYQDLLNHATLATLLTVARRILGRMQLKTVSQLIQLATPSSTPASPSKATASSLGTNRALLALHNVVATAEREVAAEKEEAAAAAAASTADGMKTVSATARRVVGEEDPAPHAPATPQLGAAARCGTDHLNGGPSASIALWA